MNTDKIMVWGRTFFPHLQFDHSVRVAHAVAQAHVAVLPRHGDAPNAQPGRMPGVKHGSNAAMRADPPTGVLCNSPILAANQFLSPDGMKTPATQQNAL